MTTKIHPKILAIALLAALLAAQMHTICAVVACHRDSPVCVLWALGAALSLRLALDVVMQLLEGAKP